jgi:hypothetical protein
LSAAASSASDVQNERQNFEDVDHTGEFEDQQHDEHDADYG